MRLLTGASLREAITRVSRGQTVCCAVAFWGAGADNLIGPLKGREVRLICNLKMGGTNPDVIAELIESGAIVQQIDRLHAKVYIDDQWAVVTSANASINGLGLEGADLAGWIEAGVEVPAQEARPWFEEVWKQSRPIQDQDIIDAGPKFRERAMMKPTADSFVDFHLAQAAFPLVEWYGDLEYDYNDREIKHSIGYVNKTVHDQIDVGFDVESPKDRAVFRRGRWCLRWVPTADGVRDKRSRLRWTCSSGTYVPNAFTYKGRRPQGSVLAMDPMPPVPFNPADPKFLRVFDRIMSRDEFRSLRAQDYQGSWFTPARLKKIWEFWAALRSESQA